jgi:hypothetical protein
MIERERKHRLSKIFELHVHALRRRLPCFFVAAVAFGIASIAEFERELIRDRVKSRIAAAKSKGKRWSATC